MFCQIYLYYNVKPKLYWLFINFLTHCPKTLFLPQASIYDASQIMKNVQESIGALPQAKRRWFHQILKICGVIFFYFFFSNSNNLRCTSKHWRTAPAKGNWFHQILVSFSIFYYFLKKKKKTIQTISVRFSHSKEQLRLLELRFWNIEQIFASQRRCSVCGFVGKGLVHTAQSSPKCLMKCLS